MPRDLGKFLFFFSLQNCGGRHLSTLGKQILHRTVRGLCPGLLQTVYWRVIFIKRVVSILTNQHNVHLLAGVIWLILANCRFGPILITFSGIIWGLWRAWPAFIGRSYIICLFRRLQLESRFAKNILVKFMCTLQFFFVNVLWQTRDGLGVWVVLVVDVASSQIKSLESFFNLGQIHTFK